MTHNRLTRTAATAGIIGLTLIAPVASAKTLSATRSAMHKLHPTEAQHKEMLKSHLDVQVTKGELTAAQETAVLAEVNVLEPQAKQISRLPKAQRPAARKKLIATAKTWLQSQHITLKQLGVPAVRL